MEGLSLLVGESLARHGFTANFDHRRLQWSGWFRCASGFSVALLPSKPGIYALAEEVLAPGATSAAAGKRMLALSRISEAADLGLAFSRFFLPGSPEQEQLASGRCFARYAVMEDTGERGTALAALRQWMACSAEVAVGAGHEAPARSSVGGLFKVEVQDRDAPRQDLHLQCSCPQAPERY
jgi:hypothetical protein